MSASQPKPDAGREKPEVQEFSTKLTHEEVLTYLNEGGHALPHRAKEVADMVAKADDPMSARDAQGETGAEEGAPETGGEESENGLTWRYCHLRGPAGPDKTEEEVRAEAEAQARALPQGPDLMSAEELAVLWPRLRAVRVLGEGNFGPIKLVAHRQSGERFVIKTFSKAALDAYGHGADDLGYVLRERRLLQMTSALLAKMEGDGARAAALGGGRLMSLHGVFEDESCLYFLTTPACERGSLRALLDSSPHRCVGEERAAFYAAQCVGIVGWLHARRVLYRDLKAENLLLDEAGYLVLIDLGFAKLVDADGGRAMTLCGTPEYMAPEVIDGPSHGAACDWWSLGVLTFEMLTGSTPFIGFDEETTYARILSDEPPIWPLIHTACCSPFRASADARVFVEQLLQREEANRLGAAPGGTDAVSGHQWFANAEWDWGALRARSMPPPPLAVRAGQESRPPQPEGGAWLAVDEPQPPNLPPSTLKRWQFDMLDAAWVGCGPDPLW